MTSMAFGFGVLPLALATGAGAGAQKAIGTCVLGGMITATFLVAVCFHPALLMWPFSPRLFGQTQEKPVDPEQHSDGRTNAVEKEAQ